jgi:hypothetical protein
MKTVINIIVSMVVGIALMNGCASLKGGDPVQVVPNGDGVAAGVNPLQLDKAPGFVANNWGKLLTGAVAAVGTVEYGRRNGWWLRPSNSADNNTTSTDTATDSSTKTTTDSSQRTKLDYLNLHVRAGDNSPVTITVNYKSPVTAAP